MTDLKILCQEMADLTLPKCRQCRVPLSCCDSMYCEMAIEIAAAHGITLAPTGHPTLPMMGPTGCTVAPYLRPLCTMHVCSINNLGADVRDIKFTKDYFKLRTKIARLEELND